MSKIEIPMYTVRCDNCGETYQDDHYSFIAWRTFDQSWDNASDSDWMKQDGKHYCSQCYTINDEDEIVIDVQGRRRIINVKEMRDGQVAEIIEWIGNRYVGIIVKRIGDDLIAVDNSHTWINLFYYTTPMEGCIVRLIES